MTLPSSGAPAGPSGTGSHPYDTDVVIIGAGPVGLTPACALAHHGVRFRLFEQRTEPRRHSRADNVWSRPQELLASLGVRVALRAPADRADLLAQYCQQLTAGATDVRPVGQNA